MNELDRGEREDVAAMSAVLVEFLLRLGRVGCLDREPVRPCFGHHAPVTVDFA